MSKGTKKGNNNGIAVLVIFMVIGFAMAIGGIVMTVDRKHKDSYYGTATGKITDISHHTDSDGDDMYVAVYTYYVDDIEYTFADDTSSSVRHSMGKIVDIRYNPEHPEIAYIGGKVWMGVILLDRGILFVLAATLGFVNGGDGPQTAGRKLASINALGAINDFTVGVYKIYEKKYYSNSFKGYYEITSLTGTISTMDGEYYAHLHMSAGNEKGEVFGGHLNRV